jgi:nucleoside-diphosphate-sugar epimerase
VGRLDELGPIEDLVDGADAILHGAYLHPEPPPVPQRTVAEHWVQTNFVGTLRLLERTSGVSGKQMIYVSSLHVFGLDPNLDPLGDQFRRDENFPVWPRDFYGAQRAAMEKVIIAATHTYDLNTSVFRLGWVLGDRDVWEATPFSQTIDEVAEFGEIRTTIGGCVLTVEDAAEILADAVGDASVQGCVYNTFDRWYDFAETADTLRDLMSREVRIVCPPARPPRSPVLADRLHARYDRFQTEAKIRELLATLVRRRGV